MRITNPRLKSLHKKSFFLLPNEPVTKKGSRRHESIFNYIDGKTLAPISLYHTLWEKAITIQQLYPISPIS